MKNELRKALNRKEDLIQDIVDVDGVLFKYLNMYKNRTAEQIAEVREVKDAVMGYAAASQK